MEIEIPADATTIDTTLVITEISDLYKGSLRFGGAVTITGGSLIWYVAPNMLAVCTEGSSTITLYEGKWHK
jgi:hypothetical protein